MDSFREYKNFKGCWKSKRRIPVIRILLLLAAIYAVYASGAVGKAYHLIEEKRNSVGAVEPFLPGNWAEACEHSGGKAFALGRKRLVQCSWTISGAASLANLPEHGTLRYAVSAPGTLYPIQAHWLADSTDFENPLVIGFGMGSSVRWIFHVMLPDSNFAWTLADGCRFPGACPRNPLQGGALQIQDDFDFGGRENLLVKDFFSGIGEAPVFPIFSGRILSVERDSLGFRILIDHGGNLFSRISELSQIAPGIEAGKFLSADEELGRLPPSDSAGFFLEVLRNGRFVRWDRFFHEAHVASARDIDGFRSQIGF